MQRYAFTIIGIISALWAISLIGAAPWYIVIGTAFFVFMGLGSGYAVFLLDTPPTEEQDRQAWIARQM